MFWPNKAVLLLLLQMGAAALAQGPPSSSVFDKDGIHEIRLTFAQPDFWQQLTANYEGAEDNVPYIAAGIVWGENKFDSAGVRFKGSSSYRGATTRKKPFRIKLNEFVRGQKIDGMASFSLSNAWNDPSFVREKAYYEMAAAAGLKSPRSSFADLYINDEYYGLYVLSEVVNGDFLENHFGKDDDGGNLYKANLGTSFEYLGSDVASYKNFWEKQSNEEADEWSDLIELCRLIDQTPAAEFSAKLEPILDLESILTALALDNLTVNLDSYAGMGQNFYIYRRPSDNRWAWIPWDPSLAFGALNLGLSAQQMRDLPLEWTRGAGPNPARSTARPLATKLWQVPQYKQRYREIYANLVASNSNPSALIDRLNALREMIRPSVIRDGQKLVTTAQFESSMTLEGNVRSSAPGLRPFLEGRYASVRAQLAGVAPVSITTLPSSLRFAAVAGAQSPARRTIAFIPSDSSKSFSFSAVSSAPWLVLSPASGAVSTPLSVSANTIGLAPGSYTASISANISGVMNSPITVPVTLSVTDTPALIVTPSVLTFNFSVGSSVASQTIQAISTQEDAAITISASSTNCGTFLSVSPTSSRGAATATVSIDIPNFVPSVCTGSITFTAAGLPTVTVPVTLSFIDNQPGRPVISGIVNGASFTSGPVAPGEIVTLFGAELGGPGLINGVASNGKLPTTLDGARVTFDGVAAPLLYVRNNQIGAVVPFEVAGKSQTVVEVTAKNGQSSSPMALAISTVAPALFTLDGSGAGEAVAVNTSGAVNGAGTPAAMGSTVIVYLTGAGVLDPAEASGTIAAASPAKIAAPVRATIGGQAATVVSAGAVPGSVLGLYQVALLIPESAETGELPLQVIVADIPTQPGVTLSIKEISAEPDLLPSMGALSSEGRPFR